MVQPTPAQSDLASGSAKDTSAIPPDATIDVELRKVFKIFGSFTAVQGVDLQVRKGEFFSILGPSGCGKTTLLRLIAGFEEPSAGEILIEGQPMTYVPAHRRSVNTVFQNYALFGHMSIWENVAFGLRVRGVDRATIQAKVNQALALVQLDQMGDRRPHQLSGGQQQRIALARALINQPTVILLDEPLSALDVKLRKQMQVELSNLQANLGTTFIMVTHDQEEALSISSRIAVVNKGQIEQVGTPSQIYNQPRTEFVAEFIGDTNLFQCEVESEDDQNLILASAEGLKIIAAKPVDWWGDRSAAEQVVVSVRPEKVRLSTEPLETSTQYPNCYTGTLNNMLYFGDRSQYFIDLDLGKDKSPKQITVTRSPQQGIGAPEFNIQTGNWKISNLGNNLGNDHNGADFASADFDSQVYAYWSSADCLVMRRSN
ncbi:spermidine/putrescine ABC transporter ATPase subunit [Thalassoporum mexicanum PCC 7367]|uniref:ABC transporter ATP-binding protein n=1 Tax=Thalassoporum mexicanum TaxID=3457544 RepID=UPI00029FE42A|nr:ABC transporter ATP-binding protein [Pseudanabaena sp. PCC 7367]AFY69923.1 spermidine/putrescine ABC transporter ATPase subunit [Pseudanabaena sp. PCC 7367]